MKLMIVLGARPQIIKSAPIIHEALEQDEIELQLVHTGQHYDFEMSKIFFGELDLPDPQINLGIGSGTHAFQTGKMMIGLEDAMQKLKPNLVMVPGDTNSTLAGALAAAKLNVPVAHVEAGARSYDMRMPEEVNRKLTDHCSQILFAPTQNCALNLSKEGLSKDKVYVSGDSMYDALLQHLPSTLKCNVLDKFDLRKEKYGLLTLHRPENVDDPVKLSNIIRAMIKIENLTIVFPVHPRTKMRLSSEDLSKIEKKASNFTLLDPVGYNSMLSLISNARIVFTDSGGVQKEAFWLHTPCVTIRESTEWVETLQLGANTLAKCDEADIIQKTKKLLTTKDLRKKLRNLPNPFGEGQASVKIIDIIKKGINEG
jgi:UDP-N-acetylglucosamine 2-epimerase (non-hydrolysing)